MKFVEKSTLINKSDWRNICPSKEIQKKKKRQLNSLAYVLVLVFLLLVHLLSNV